MIKLKYFLIIVFVSCIMLFLGACDRSTNPVWRLPSASVTSVSGVCTQIVVSDFPLNKAYCSILDQDNNPLVNFAIGNFNIVEDGRPTVVTQVMRVDNLANPLYVSIVLDRSGSMGGQATTDANNAAIAFVNGLGSLDQAAIIDFASTVTIASGFTSDKTALIAAINSGVANGGTALYDGAGVGVSEVSGRNGRKFVIAMTDGNENSSSTYTTAESLVEHSNRNGLAVFTVGFENPGWGAPDYSLLEYIANETGGRSFRSDDSAGLQAIFEDILYQFQNLVEISFRTRLSGSRELKVYFTYGELADIFGRKYSS